MNEPVDASYVLALQADGEGSLYYRDDENGEGASRWFNVSDGLDVVSWEHLKTDYRELIHMEAIDFWRRDGVRT